jgi:hypothetical protein
MRSLLALAAVRKGNVATAIQVNIAAVVEEKLAPLMASLV